MSQILMISNDQESKRKNLEVLARSNFNCTEVADCLDGVQMVGCNNFEAVIIDEKLSDISGFKACQKIRQLSNSPIILLGEKSSEDVWFKAEELGFDMYLKKPVGPRELEAYVKSLVRRALHRNKTRPINKETITGMQVDTAVSPEVASPVVKPPGKSEEPFVQSSKANTDYPVHIPGDPGVIMQVPGEEGSKSDMVKDGFGIRLSGLVASPEFPVVSKTIMNKKMGAVTLFHFGEGQQLRPHKALFDVLVYVLDGEAEITISNNKSHIKKDEMAVMPANQIHAVKAVNKCKMLLVMIKS